ncbi:Phospholipid scramblase [Phaffia rhodozyma]|uniref:Phospholipid scramblase n=1 Tax=Phaffia rhodozyma TaxID=264483 RepID=A0A0F7ST49_PHARH|nr:Phospholipid scramblase [Phaffia rhodozyma]
MITRLIPNTVTLLNAHRIAPFGLASTSLLRPLSMTPALPRRSPSTQGPRNAININRRPEYRPSGSPSYDTNAQFNEEHQHGHSAQPEYTQLPGAWNVTVEVPEDAEGVLKRTHGASLLLEQPALVVTRQIEMLNLFAGFEQANRYQITNPEGLPVGFIAEEDSGFMGTITRQLFRTHRPFRSVIMDVEGNPILWVRRPFQFINSKIYVHSHEGPDSPLVGEAQQAWHLWRRKYNLFLSRFRSGSQEFDQFAEIDEGLWAWSFLVSDRSSVRGSIGREFGGFGREIFTDTGRYVIRFDAVQEGVPDGQKEGELRVLPPKAESDKGLTLDERAIMLATAISIDFDYFSRHSGQGGMGFPFLFMGGGGHGADLENQSGQPDQRPVLDDEANLSPGMGTMAGAAGVADDMASARQPSDYPAPTSTPSQPDLPTSTRGQADDLPWWEKENSSNGDQGMFGQETGWGQSSEEEEVWGETFEDDGGIGDGESFF